MESASTVRSAIRCSSGAFASPDLPFQNSTRQDIGSGRPVIARNTSNTKSAMAMSLKSVAWGKAGQNWLAAQNRKAQARRIALTSSDRDGRRTAS